MRRRLIFPLHALFFAIALCLAAQPSWAERTFVDQLGRRVTLPDTIERAVVLQHHTLNLVAQLGATDRLVGVMDDWKAQLGSGSRGSRRGWRACRPAASSLRSTSRRSPR